MTSGSFENNITSKLFTYKYLCVRVFVRICHKIAHKGWYAIKHHQTKPIISQMST